MIIICENCKAKYMVPPNSLGKEGRSVKCAKCAHTWFTKPSIEEIEKSKHAVEPPKFRTRHDHSKLPKIINKKAPLLLKIIPICLGFFILLLTIIFYQDITNMMPGSSILYKIINRFPTDGLSMQNFVIRKINTNNGQNLLIKGQIFNESTVERKVPYIRFIIYDKNHNILKQYTEPSKEINIKSGDAYTINFTVSTIDKAAKTIQLDIGNKFDLFLR